jgi:nucleotide-binding universal stress UspA family protein
MDSERKVLVCLATSPSGTAVAKEGLRFASILGATAVFLNVGQDTPDRRRTLMELIDKAGKKNLEENALLIRPGNPYSVIAAAAAELRAGMIILGALNRDPAWARVWGSVARKIARRAPCSVLLLSSASPHRAGDRVVVGIGFDIQSAAAMPTILHIARESHSDSIHFVREFPNLENRWEEEDRARIPLTSEERLLIRQKAEQQLLADFLSGYDLSGLNIRIAAIAGREGMEVVAYARRQRADLVILPVARRRLTIWDRFFRHPLESVLMDLPCALLLHRPSQNDVSAKVAFETRRPSAKDK